MKRLAVIPARSGSKGLKDKNIIDLCGRPMMNYSIEAAISSGLFSRVVCSTDSEIYGGIALRAGAEVVYRDIAVSDDKATTYDFIKDLFQRIENDFDYFVLLQPTSPLRTCRHIREAVELFDKHINEFDFLCSVKEAEHPSVLVRAIEEDLSLKHFDTDFKDYRRQKYKEYSPNGAIFIGKIQSYMSQGHFFGKRSLGYIMDKADSVDIDDEIDYWLVQEMLKNKLKC